MILFKPVLIESADLPMEQFPEGTIATHPDHWPVERCSCSRWESDGPDRYDPDMIGWTALVPIEVHEVHSEEYSSFHLIEGMTSLKPFVAYLPTDSGA